MFGMRRFLIAALILGLSAVSALSADPTTPLAEGQNPVVQAQEPETVSPLNVNAVPGESGSNGSLKIDIDKIKLDRLYQLIDAKPAREQVNMTLRECILHALDANQDILIAEFEPQKSDADILAAKGAFDPLAGAGAKHTHSSARTDLPKQLFVIPGGTLKSSSDQDDLQTSIGGKLHLGTTYELSLGSAGQETTVRTPKATQLLQQGLQLGLGLLSGNLLYSLGNAGTSQSTATHTEDWTSGLTLTVTQPLLRGAGLGANTARIRIAKNARGTAENQVESAVMGTVADVVKAYWGLGAIESANVRRESLANAERLLTISEKRLQVGTAAAIEVLQAKAGVATRQSDLIAARGQVEDAEDVLKRLLDLREGNVFSPKAITPSDRPNLMDVTLDESASVARALDNRPEIRSAELNIESADIERKRAANDLLPQLDITGSISQGGKDKELGNSVSNIFDNDSQSYSVGVRGSVPIRNRAAKGVYKRAEVTTRQAEQQREKVKQQIILAVRMAMRAVDTSKTLVESTRQTRMLQETNVAAEEKRLKLGVTTSYHVLQVQEDLTTARTAEVQSLTSFEKAVVELQLAEGTVLKNFGVEFEGAAGAKPAAEAKPAHKPAAS